MEKTGPDSSIVEHQYRIVAGGHKQKLKRFYGVFERQLFTAAGGLT